MNSLDIIYITLYIVYRATLLAKRGELSDAVQNYTQVSPFSNMCMTSNIIIGYMVGIRQSETLFLES